MRKFGTLTGLVMLAGCAAVDNGPKLEIPDSVYDLNFESGSCGVLKTGAGSNYSFDSGCDGSVDYSQPNIQRIGNRFFVEGGSFVVEALTATGFEATFSFRGNQAAFIATRRGAN